MVLVRVIITTTRTTVFSLSLILYPANMRNRENYISTCANFSIEAKSDSTRLKKHSSSDTNPTMPPRIELSQLNKVLKNELFLSRRNLSRILDFLTRPNNTQEQIKQRERLTGKKIGKNQNTAPNNHTTQKQDIIIQNILGNIFSHDFL